MNVADQAEMTTNSNVLSLFSTVKVEMPDPLQELLNEAEAEAWAEEDIIPEAPAKRLLVSDKQFPDQSLYTLDQQLANLTKSLGRLKFYLNDLDDLLPSKLN